MEPTQQTPDQTSGTGSTDEPKQVQDTGQTNPNPVAQDGSVTPAPNAATSFRHPRIAGKSPEEIDRIVAILDDTVREQGRELNRVHQPAPVAVEPVREAPKVTNEQFWENPVAAVQSLLQATIQPLSEEVRGAKAEIKAPSIRENLRQKYEDFAVLEPAINEILRRRGVANPESVTDEGVLETVYFTAYGYASKNGLFDNKAPAAREPVNNNPNPAPASTPAPVPQAIPQHRPSSAPLPTGAPKAQALRDLTENERRLARETWPDKSPEEQKKLYIEYLEMDEEDVVTKEIA